MKAIVLYPTNEDQLKLILSFTESNKIDNIILEEEEKKKLSGILLSSLASKNPRAKASMEEIISVVEEVRSEKYGKKNNNS